jgi:hypothetical protein
MLTTPREPLMPAIMEAWFLASENTCHGRSGPCGKLFRIADNAAWFEMKPEVKSSPACLP